MYISLWINKTVFIKNLLINKSLRFAQLHFPVHCRIITLCPLHWCVIIVTSPCMYRLQALSVSRLANRRLTCYFLNDPHVDADFHTPEHRRDQDSVLRFEQDQVFVLPYRVNCAVKCGRASSSLLASCHIWLCDSSDSATATAGSTRPCCLTFPTRITPNRVCCKRRDLSKCG